MSYPDNDPGYWEDRRRGPGRPLRRDDHWPDDSYDRPLKHSGLGISSFFIAVGVGLFDLVILVVAGLLTMRKGKELDENSPEAIVLGLLLIGGLVIAVGGAVLGGVGMAQSRRNKLFAGIGLCLNCFIAIGVLGLICVGILAGE